MPRVKVALAARTYPIDIGPDLLETLPDRLRTTSRARRLLVIADRTAWRLHGARLRRALRGAPPYAVELVRPGEASKSLAEAARLFEACRRHEIGRDGAILAFGGGVVGDLAGFVAATWQRGVDLVMVPTTLLAQVDSAVGGKVAVNVGGIKNSVGAFHQPRLVLADLALLATLPRRELRSALAEVVKYGMIADRRLLARVERTAGSLLAGDPAALSPVVTRCCRIKADLVARDERESGPRVLLNYGHTIGHAFEAAAAGRLTHGEAVALGMRGAARLAEDLGWLTQGDRVRQDRLLDRLGLPRTYSAVTVPGLMAKIKHDKKVRARQPRFVLTRGIGSASLAAPIEASSIRRVLAALIKT